MSDALAIACVVSATILLVTLILTVAVLLEAAAGRRDRRSK